MAFAFDLFLSFLSPTRANMVPHVAITIWKKQTHNLPCKWHITEPSPINSIIRAFYDYPKQLVFSEQLT